MTKENQYNTFWTAREDGRKLFRNPGYDGQVAELINKNKDNDREYRLVYS
jgi:hypothetical protein